MEVPIENLYYLLCYAWNRDMARDVVQAGSVRAKRPEDLLAKLLAEEARRILRRGIDRGYVVVDEETACPRGKFLVAETVKRQLLSRARVTVRRDDLSHDIPHNRILAATLDLVGSLPSLDREVRKDVRRTRARMPTTTPLDVRPADIAAVSLHRNNAHYGLALDLCRLLLAHLTPARAGSEATFRDFRASSQVMGLLFEGFVRSFLAREQSDYQVAGGKIIAWPVTASPRDLGLLPVMKTDIWLRRGTDHVIVDCKYTKAPLTEHHGKPRLKAGNLYQMHAYLSNAEAQGLAPRNTTGLLLYTQVDRRLRARYRFEQREILVRTVNLAQPWQGIHDELLELVADLRTDGARKTATLRSLSPSLPSP